MENKKNNQGQNNFNKGQEKNAQNNNAGQQKQHEKSAQHEKAGQKKEGQGQHKNHQCNSNCVC